MAGKSPAPNALWPKYLDRAVELRREGLSNTEIADQLGIDYRNIYHWMGSTPKRIGGSPYHPHGLRYRAMYLRECGYNISEIAEEMGVPRSTVGDWVKGMPCG